jgi:phosphonate transport system ATP-binding protein
VSVHVEALRLELGERCLLAIPHLHIAPGERVALVGPNGAGKSTLLRLLGGQAPAPWQGRLQVLGQTVTSGAALPRDLRQRVAMVHQGLHLVDRLSARDNLLIGALSRCQGWAGWRAGLAGHYPAAIAAQADAWLQRLGLSALAQHRVDRLSGGERQRVAVGRAALQRPELLLADEATAQLDPQASAQACQWLDQAVARGSLISVVHQLDLLPRLASRVIGLRAGRVVLDRAVDDSPSLQQALRELYASEPDVHPFDGAGAQEGAHAWVRA